MAELNGTAAFEVEFLQAVREDAYSTGFIVGVYSVLIAVEKKGVTAALLDAEECVNSDKIGQQVAEMLQADLEKARAGKMTINIGIPQIIWLVTAVLGLIYEIINHDKPREPHNAYTFAISTVISFLLLYWGGFFG